MNNMLNEFAISDEDISDQEFCSSWYCQACLNKCNTPNFNISTQKDYISEFIIFFFIIFCVCFSFFSTLSTVTDTLYEY